MATHAAALKPQNTTRATDIAAVASRRRALRRSSGSTQFRSAHRPRKAQLQSRLAPRRAPTRARRPGAAVQPTAKAVHHVELRRACVDPVRVPRRGSTADGRRRWCRARAAAAAVVRSSGEPGAARGSGGTGPDSAPHAGAGDYASAGRCARSKAVLHGAGAVGRVAAGARSG